MELVEKLRRNLELAKRCFGIQAQSVRWVSLRDVEEKVLELAKEMGVDKVVFDPWFPSHFSYDVVRDRIEINPELVADYLNDLLEVFPSVDWQKVLERSLKHEVVHREQAYYLLSRGFTFDDIARPEMRLAKEFHAHNVVPVLFEEKTYWRWAIFSSIDSKNAKRMLRNLDVWVWIIYYFDEDDIATYFYLFAPDEAEKMLKLKRVAPKIWTMDDIVKYAPEIEKILETESFGSP
jgi:hypothetical protein